MMTRMRTNIELRPEQVERLGEYCERERVSRAEAIRRAVDGLVADQREAARVDALKAAFGLWKDRGESTDEYLERIRKEWEH